MKTSIVVRFTDSGAGTEQFSDLDIVLSINFERDDVNKLVNTAWLKATIRSSRPGAVGRRLRLIYNGRVLNEVTRFKGDILEPKLRQLRALGDTGDLLQIYVHCLVGDKLTPQQLKEEKELDKPPEASTAPEVEGFDRLLQQGFSQQDVNELRQQFHQIYLPEQPDNSGTVDMEEEERRQETIRQLEERWIESTINNNPITTPELEDDTGVIVPQNATAVRARAELEEANRNEDILIGLLIGGFLGSVAFVFLLVDDSMFNKEQQIAIVAGIMCNTGLAFLRGQWL